MKIGIDISQMAYPNTGVSNYLENLVFAMVKDTDHEFVLFFSSLRQEVPQSIQGLVLRYSNVSLKTFKIPPMALHVMWNVLHVIPIEIFVGNIDVFMTSDWTEPPSRHAKKTTILYDLIVYKYPAETAAKIVKVQRKKLSWVKREVDIIYCISESTKKDAEKILGVTEDRLKVVYPGITL